MNDLYNEIFSRNVLFLTESEQDKLRRSTISIAGVGGVGGLLAERLIRLGVGYLKITDPEDFELSNLNRQFGSSMLSLGRNKAQVVFAHLKDINPQAKIHYSETGVKTQDDANTLVSDCDLVVNEMDFGLFRESIFLQRAAREKGIYCISANAIGFGALVVIFDPEGLTLEEYNKLSPDIDVDDAEDLMAPLERICPVIPSYAIADAAEADTIIREIIAGARPAPSHSIGSGLAAVLAANEVTNILLRKRDVASAPQYTYVDLVDRQFIVGTVS